MKYQQCVHCVMDTTDPDITFEGGVCNHCLVWAFNEGRRIADKAKLPSLVESIRRPSQKYDVLLGLSGGVDSSYCLHILKQLGLRPYCFSIDNGWNSPEADENIMRLVEHYKVPFFRYTIDLRKFKELQAAFLQSGTENIEIPTDHILMAASYELAERYGIKTIISGGNHATEGIMPRAWGYQPRDLTHIKDIYRNFFHRPLTETDGPKGPKLPLCGLWKYNWYRWVKGIKTVNLLDYYEYNRDESVSFLEAEVGYKPYGEKHGESVWTRWFQNFYLYEKFGIDKRKAHLSSLILSGQMTRKAAMEELLNAPVYPELGIESKIMKYPVRKYTDYATDEKLWNFLTKVIKVLKWLHVVN